MRAKFVLVVDGAVERGDLAVIVEEEADARNLLRDASQAASARIDGDAEEAGRLVVEQVAIMGDVLERLDRGHVSVVP